VVACACAAASALSALDRQAYAISKQRLRSRSAAWGEQHLEVEMVGPPIRDGS
jgi:hypothetical protein